MAQQLRESVAAAGKLRHDTPTVQRSSLLLEKTDAQASHTTSATFGTFATESSASSAAFAPRRVTCDICDTEPPSGAGMLSCRSCDCDVCGQCPQKGKRLRHAVTPFDGRWATTHHEEHGLVVIRDGLAQHTGHDEDAIFAVVSPLQCTLTSMDGSEVFCGQLVADGSVEWDDGDVWNRVVDCAVINSSRTTKHTLFAFVAENTMEHFHKQANVYWFVMYVVMFMGVKTPLYQGNIELWSTAVMLGGLMAVSAVFAAYDDRRRHLLAEEDLVRKKEPALRRNTRPTSRHARRTRQARALS